MAFESGFYNSVDRDRRYNAEHMSMIFDGIIRDGVFENIGERFVVKAVGGYKISIGTGMGWFNSKWIRNDDTEYMTLSSPNILLDRYDAVVIEIDTSNEVRNGTVKIVKGVANEHPSYPTLINNDDVHQYPIAYILRKYDKDKISQSDIEYQVGIHESIPYITGILNIASIIEHYARWEVQWQEWFAHMVNEGRNDTASWSIYRENEYNNWFTELKKLLSDVSDGTDVASLIAPLAERMVALEMRFDELVKKGGLEYPLEDSDGEYIQAYTYSNTVSDIATTTDVHGFCMLSTIAVINADIPTGGTEGQVLTMGADGIPYWADPTGGSGVAIASAEGVDF